MFSGTLVFRALAGIFKEEKKSFLLGNSHENLLLHFMINARIQGMQSLIQVGAAYRFLPSDLHAKFMLQPRAMCRTAQDGEPTSTLSKLRPVPSPVKCYVGH